MAEREKGFSKLPIVAKLAGALMIPLAVACGGKGDGKDHQADNIVPTAIASLESPQAKCSPEFQRTALEKLDKMISQAENLKYYNWSYKDQPKLEPEDLDYISRVHQAHLLEGRIINSKKVPGLRDLQSALDGCDIEKAKTLMSQSSSGLGSIFENLSALGQFEKEGMITGQIIKWAEPPVWWPQAKIDKYDPKRIFVPDRGEDFLTSKVDEQLLIDFMRLYYYLDSASGH